MHFRTHDKFGKINTYFYLRMQILYPITPENINQSLWAHVEERVASPTLRLHLTLCKSPCSPLPVPSNSQQEASTCSSHELFVINKVSIIGITVTQFNCSSLPRVWLHSGTCRCGATLWLWLVSTLRNWSTRLTICNMHPSTHRTVLLMIHLGKDSVLYPLDISSPL